MGMDARNDSALEQLLDNQNTLIGHRICPYVQRVVAVLKEKNIRYKKVDIDLDDKPYWLIKISPSLRIPVLVVDGSKPIFESVVICDYLDSTCPSLYPSDLASAYVNRSWIAYSSSILDVFAVIIYQCKSISEIQGSINKIEHLAIKVENELSGADFYNGSKLNMIDIMYSPIFRYFNFFSRKLNLDMYEKLPKIKSWSNNVLSTRSIAQSVPEVYDEELVQFVEKSNPSLSGVIK